MNVHRGARRILLHGLVMVWAGLVWGFVVPMTPFPRLALVAHIEFEAMGVLFIVEGLVLAALPHRVGGRSLGVMMLAVWLAWLMILSEAANAWWGTNQMLPIAAGQAGASGAAPWQELALKLTHIAAGTGLLVAWTLLIAGFLRPADGTAKAGANPPPAR